MMAEEKYFLSIKADEINDVLVRASTKPVGAQIGNFPVFSSGRDLADSGRNRDSYALALKTTDGPAESVEIYPDEGSNIVVTVHGYTEQEGKGDPSPENVRGINVVTAYFGYRHVFDGTENISLIKVNETHWYFNFEEPVFQGDGDFYGVGMSNVYNSGNTSTEDKVCNMSYTSGIRFSDLEYTTVDAMKAHLSELFKLGKPLTMWFNYRTADVIIRPKYDSPGYLPVSIGSTFPITSKGICLPITGPLCDGDYVVSNQGGSCVEYREKSVLVLTGEEDFKFTSQGNYYTLLVPASGMKWGSLGFCSHFAFYSKTSSLGAIPNLNIASRFNSNALLIRNDSWATIDDAVAYVSQQYANGTPITIVYERNTPVDYIDDPVQLIAEPDSAGKVTVSGKKTVSVTYNKSLSHAFSELQSAIIALGANMQGGL